MLEYIMELINKNPKERFKKNKNVVLVVGTLQLFFNYLLIFEFYHTGKLFSTIPIIFFNITVIYLLMILVIFDEISDKNRIVIEVFAYFLILLLITIIFFLLFSNGAAYISFNEKKVSIQSEDFFSGYPYRASRTINILSHKKDPNLIKTTVGKEKIISKKGLYYKKGSFTPFSGVYIKLDKEEQRVREGTIFKLGKKTKTKIYSDHKITTIRYDDFESKFGKGIIYKERNVKKYNRKTGITTEISYFNDTIKKYKGSSEDCFYVASYKNGNLVREEVYGDKMKLYYNNGNLAFVGGLSDKYLIGQVKHYYENGQVKFKGSVTEIKAPSIYDLKDLKYEDSYKYMITVIADFSTDFNKKTGNISINTKAYEVLADHSWYEDQKGFSSNSSNSDLKKGMTGSWEFYYENGELKAKGEYSAGNHVGLWSFYYPNGQLEAVGRYSTYGVEKGEWKYYYDNGQLRSMGLYSEPSKPKETYALTHSFWESDVLKEPLKTDKWEYYSKDGKLMAEGKYIDGEKAGKWLLRKGENARLKEVNF